MKHNGTKSKLDLARKRLALDIEKQEYAILKDMLRLRHKYHPINVGANFVMDILNDADEGTGVKIDMDAIDSEILGEKKTGKGASKKVTGILFNKVSKNPKYLRKFKNMGMNLLTIADAYIDNFAQKLAEKAAEMDLLEEEQEENKNEELKFDTKKKEQQPKKETESPTVETDSDSSVILSDKTKNDIDPSLLDDDDSEDYISEDDLKL